MRLPTVFSENNSLLVPHQQPEPSGSVLDGSENTFFDDAFRLSQILHPEQHDISDKDMQDVMRCLSVAQSETQDSRKEQDKQDMEHPQVQLEEVCPQTGAHQIESHAELDEFTLSNLSLQDWVQAQMQWQKQDSQPQSQFQSHREQRVPGTTQLQIQTQNLAQAQLQLQQPLMQETPQVQSRLQNQSMRQEQQTNEGDLLHQIQDMQSQIDALQSQVEIGQQKLQPQQISQHPEAYSHENSAYEGSQPQMQHLQQTLEGKLYRQAVSGHFDLSTVRITRSSPHPPQHYAQLPEAQDSFFDYMTCRSSPILKSSNLPQDSECSVWPTEHSTREPGHASSPILKTGEDNWLLLAAQAEKNEKNKSQTVHLRAAEPRIDQTEDMELDEILPNVPPKQPIAQTIGRRRKTQSNNTNPRKRRRVAKNRNSENFTTNARSESNQLPKQLTERSFDPDLPLSVIQRQLRDPSAAPRFGSAKDVNIYNAMRIGSSTRRVKCMKCNEIFGASDALDRHIAMVHSNPAAKKHICQECRQPCSSKVNLLRHWNNAHSGELEFVCDVCGARFCTKRSLSVHRTKQHPDVYMPRPKRKKFKFWECTLCDYTSDQNFLVIRHFFTKHTDAVGMECLHGCGKTFKSAANAKVHFFRCTHRPMVDEQKYERTF